MIAEATELTGTVQTLPANSPAGHVWRNLAMDLTLAVAIGLMCALASTLLPPMARQAGLDALGLSLLAAVPYLGAVVALGAPRFGPRRPREMVWPIALATLPGALLVIAPSPMTIVACAFTVWLAVWLLMPFQVRLWGEIYPDERRGRFIATLGIARVGVGAIGAAIGGIAAARFGGPAAVGVGLVLSTVLACAAFGFVAEPIERERRPGVRETVAHFVETLPLRRLAVAQVVWGLGAVAAMALVPIIQIDRLGLGLGDIGLIALAATLAAIASYPAWGWIADGRGGLWVLIGASLLGAAGVACWAIASDVTMAIVGTALIALADAGLAVGQPVALTERSDPGERIAHQSAWNGLVGVRGVIAPFLVALPVAAGLLDVTSGLLLCAAIAAAGAILFVRARLQPEETEAAREEALAT